MTDRPDREPPIADTSRVFDSLARLGIAPADVGVIIVDHGSRRAESNLMLEQVVAAFRHTTPWKIVEAAHMELAEPSIETAFQLAVDQGARFVVGHPYFLAPGRHWRQDIPELFRRAAAHHPQVRYLVTAPLGLHPLMQHIMQDRIAHCLARVGGDGPACDVCADADGCRIAVGRGEVA